MLLHVLYIERERGRDRQTDRQRKKQRETERETERTHEQTKPISRYVCRSQVCLDEIQIIDIFDMMKF